MDDIDIRDACVEGRIMSLLWHFVEFHAYSLSVALEPMIRADTFVNSYDEYDSEIDTYYGSGSTTATRFNWAANQAASGQPYDNAYECDF